MSGPIGADAARRAAEIELRKAEYHRDDPSVTSRAIGWIADRMGFVFGGSTAGTLTLLLLVLVTTAVILAVVRASRLPRRRWAANEDRDPLRSSVDVDHRRLAEQHDAAGRLREAQREWLRATAQIVEVRGVLLPRPGRTAVELAREAGALLPTAAEGLALAARDFDEVWFGNRHSTEADVRGARAAYEAVRSARIERLVRPRPLESYAVPQ
ncbi:DUF4129 domain-containing protein [Jatrophihabitans sp. DSM 45814]